MTQSYWKRAFAYAERSGKFSKQATENARSWNRCAVGENFKLQDMADGEAMKAVKEQHPKVFGLGTLFFEAVKTNDVDLARKIYDWIRKNSW